MDASQQSDETPAEPEADAPPAPPRQRAWYPVWSINDDWSGRFMVLVAVLTTASLAWMYVETGSAVRTIEAGASCAALSLLASVLMIEGGGKIMVSAAERWRRYREERERLRAEGRAEGHAEGRAEGRAEGVVEGRVEGAAEQNTAWEAWLARKQAADAAGETFTEPNPAALARNSDA